MTKRITEVRQEAESEKKRLRADLDQKLQKSGARIVELTNRGDSLQTQVETLERERDALVQQRDELSRAVRERDRATSAAQAELDGLSEAHRAQQQKLALCMLSNALRQSVVAPAFSLFRHSLLSSTLCTVSDTREASASKSDDDDKVDASTVDGDGMDVVEDEEDEEDEDEEETYGVDQNGQEEWAEMLQANTLNALFTGADAVVESSRTAAGDLTEHVQNIVQSLDLFPQMYAEQLQELDRSGKGKELRDFVCKHLARAMSRCQRIVSAIGELCSRNDEVVGSLQNLVRVKGLEWHLTSLRTAGQHEVLLKLQKNQMTKLRTDYEDVLDQYGEQCEQNSKLERKIEDLQKEVEELKRTPPPAPAPVAKAGEAEARLTAPQPSISKAPPKSMEDIHQLMKEIETNTVAEAANAKASSKGKAPPAAGGKGKGPPPPEAKRGAEAPADAALAPEAAAATPGPGGTEANKGGKGKAPGKGKCPPPPPGAKEASPSTAAEPKPSAEKDAPPPTSKGKGPPGKGKGPPPPPGKGKGGQESEGGDGQPPAAEEAEAPAPAGKGKKGPAPPGGKGPAPPGGKGPAAPAGGKGPAGPPGPKGGGKDKGGKGKAGGKGSALPKAAPGPEPPKDLQPKKFHWTNVAGNRFQTSIFAQLLEEENPEADGEAKAPKPKARRVKLDIGSLTSAFFSKKKQEPTPEELAKAASSKRKTIAQCLEGKKSQAVEIFLNGCGVKVEHVVSYVVDLDEKAMSGENLGKVIDFYPNAEELPILKAFQEQNDPKVLPWGRAEDFLISLMRIPDFKLRAECCMSRGLFTEEFSGIAQDVGTLRSCLSSLVNSAALTCVFALVVQMGNYLNYGTAKGCQAGFTLDTLQLLGRVEGAGDKTYSLMRFLMDTLEMDRAVRDEALDDMKLCDAASKMDFDDSVRRLNDLEKSVGRVAAIVKSEAEGDDAAAGAGQVKDEKFCTAMQGFVSAAQGQLATLRGHVDEVTESCKKCIDLFAEKQKTPIAETLKKFADFRKDMEEARRTNLLARAKKEKAEKRRAEKENAAKTKADPSQAAAARGAAANGVAAPAKASGSPPSTGDKMQTAVKSVMRRLKVKIPDKPVLAYSQPRRANAEAGAGRTNLPKETSSGLSFARDAQPPERERMTLDPMSRPDILKVSSSLGGRISIGVAHSSADKGMGREELQKLLSSIAAGAKEAPT